MKDKSEAVEQLIDMAVRAIKSEDALRFSQAALNAANAMCSVRTSKTIGYSELSVSDL